MEPMGQVFHGLAQNTRCYNPRKELRASSHELGATRPGRPERDRSKT